MNEITHRLVLIIALFITFLSVVGEEEYFPLINGFHYKYYTSDVGGARNDFLFFGLTLSLRKNF